MTAPYCAVCRNHVDPGSSHTRVTVEKVRPDDRNDETVYYLHDNCGGKMGEWEVPA